VPGLTPDPGWRRIGAKPHLDAAMPNLSIKDVPEDIAEALRQRASRNHRSLQGELMAIIHDAVQAGDARGLPPHWGAFDGRRGTRTIEDLIEERRAKYPEPVKGGPLAVDIIRADRDSR
jgi:antitoxin FitA